jgi:acyl phosphate:glycerol-3-phosphate acyltransferase
VIVKSPVAKPFLGLRKVFHVFNSSVVPLLYWFLPFVDTAEEGRLFLLIILSCALLLYILFDGARLLSPAFNRFIMDRFSLLIRRSEEKSFTGATFVCLSFLVVVFFFSREIAVVSMLFLALGDTAAEIVGKNWGRRKYLGRSLEGMGGFFVVAVPVAWIVLQDWRVAVMGAAVGALVEFFSIGIDDNLTVPIGSAMALLILTLFI